MSHSISDLENQSRSSGEEVGFIPETQAQSAEVRSENESHLLRPRRLSRITRKRSRRVACAPHPRRVTRPQLFRSIRP
ncbi:uncharacterized protein AKAME5_000398000 [Lates japonicus]|uniref:Uncharacterized protein n=1 Tax=Lates japonicus TaxID=270547 RepID=A0AAD3MC77_LATJO|nr:uncharacterized protein AKAME5_000398000 [Lates japonicus]